MKLKIVRFKAEHLESIRQFMDERGREGMVACDAMFRGSLFNDHAFSVLRGGEYIGAAGVIPYYGSVGMAWAFITPEWRKYPFMLFGSIKRYLDKIGRDGAFSSVETLVVEGFDAGRIFVERLGFVTDGGCAKGFGPRSENLVKYVRRFQCVGNAPQEIN